MKHREDDCVAGLSTLRGLDPFDALLIPEFLRILATVMLDEETEVETKGSGSVLAPWKTLSHQTGINAVLYYTPQIFGSFGFSSVTTNLLATGVTGILQILFTLPSVLFLDNSARKTFLIVGAMGMAIEVTTLELVRGCVLLAFYSINTGKAVPEAFLVSVSVCFEYDLGPNEIDEMDGSFSDAEEDQNAWIDK
ncbi:hypothetical protein AYL99_09937 [Fonsecaea erecta]|uniref:Major facilitator superfamily (MFS) profile domain-containing protein n=1 Tax=Fonsecaea erecta TaxID=1367422 RepID=A0A178Z9N6_9EURO|nr:hypothetical protein AYL99_09937 [Fonsecaea erecta]OAP55785.1 hypothetical protein AYL99_09937 [Fonsecaea erecta]